MDKALAEIDALLAKLSVSGDSVFVLAAARQKLKAAYDALKEAAHG